MSASFLFYDLETFGTDPGRSRIAQFAAIRTDLELQPIGPPIDFLVRPADDLLPSPAAAMTTLLGPQRALREGVGEAEAFARIAEEMGQPGTCSVGYNSLRFDDEFIRYGLYRNFQQVPARIAVAPRRPDLAPPRTGGRRHKLPARAPGRGQRPARGHGARGPE